MNSGDNKTSDPHRQLINPLDKIDIKSSDKYVALSNFGINYTWKNTRNSYKMNKSKISDPTLFDGSCSVWDIQVKFEYIIKKQ